MYNNTGVMSRLTLCIFILFSVALGVLHFTGWLGNVALIWMFVPVVYVIIRHSVFALLVNSFHFAMHRFEEDMIFRDATVKHSRITDIVTLDAEAFLRGLRADDEAAGRA